jgi:hypothetical protein
LDFDRQQVPEILPRACSIVIEDVPFLNARDFFHELRAETRKMLFAEALEDHLKSLDFQDASNPVT